MKLFHFHKWSYTEKTWYALVPGKEKHGWQPITISFRTCRCGKIQRWKGPMNNLITYGNWIDGSDLFHSEQIKLKPVGQ